MLNHVPQAPDYRVDWATIDACYPWVRALKDCPQDPIHHGEGNVWIHLHMVLEALVALPAWRALPEAERAEVFWAALLHDVAKPATTRTEDDGRITARGHSHKGAVMAREILWRMDVAFSVRERICNLVRYHQIPFWLLERDNPEHLMREVSCTTRCDHLAILAEADLRGRICQDFDRVLDNIGLFSILAQEMHCFQSPFPFANEDTRYLYFRERWQAPEVAAHAAFGSEVIVMSGLCGSGKDYWLAQNHPDLPVVSLDQIRRDNGWPSSGNQGRVVAAAREAAKTYLRKGLPFAWNGTNLSQRLRGGVLDLMDKYRARITLVYREVDPTTLKRQNADREYPVPETALARLLAHWEVPDPQEASVVHYAL